MLTCREVTERSTDLLEGASSALDRVRIYAHLAMCRHCRRFNRHLRLLARVLRHHEPRRQTEPVPDQIIERILTRVAEEGQSPQDPST
ncbi:MAG: zf-HC2 domain-containing protein [Pseudomonadales bacterium]